MNSLRDTFTHDYPGEPASFFSSHPVWLKVSLVGLFLLAALLRLDNIQAPGHLIDREYTAAIFARSFYFANNPDIEPWRKEIAEIEMQQQPLLEPPITDFLVSLMYRVMGREDITSARYLTNFFWLFGGIFFYQVARKMVGVDGAVFATAYYLLVPMAIIISRSFQPDALMMMLFLASLLAIFKYFEAPSPRKLLVAVILSGITLVIRPLVIFSLIFSFFALTFYQRRHWTAIFDKTFWLYTLTSLILPVAYYGYGIIIAGYMRWKIATSFMPQLLLKPDFWKGWFEVSAGVVGPTFLILATLGFFLLWKAQSRVWAASMAASFVLFGIAFTYHIHTHPYYHIQLIPLIGICSAPLFTAGLRVLQNLPGRIWLVPVGAALLLTLYFSRDKVTDSFNIRWYESPQTAQEIGEMVQHSPRVVFIASYYGLPLEYYGEFGGAPWPVRIEDAFYRSPGETERTVQERIEQLGFTPEYFVITNFDLYNRLHPDLKAYLESEWELLAESDRYLIYQSPSPAIKISPSQETYETP